MTAVFVHGVPETPSVWDPLVEHLTRQDTEQLQLPGFGCPLPDGFEPTMHRYAAWLSEALAGFDEVDLVVHDWGALLALARARGATGQRAVVGHRHGRPR